MLTESLITSFIVVIAPGTGALYTGGIISQPLVITWIRRCFSAAFVALSIKLIMEARN